MSAGLIGLAWASRRATAPLAAASARFALTHGSEICWDTQPLSGFERGLTAQLADKYDLIVFDHPFCGDIAKAGLFRPLDDLLADISPTDFVGGSLPSYRYDGHLWGLPIDGATQAAVYRPDLVAGALPTDWSGMLDFGRSVRQGGRWLSLAVVAPHAFLVLAALLANLGHPIAQDPEAPQPVDHAPLREALRLLRELCALIHPDCFGSDAIELHEAMSARDDIVYCPTAYAYLTYAERDRRAPLAFAGFPGPRAPHHAGTVLGGTGLGITRSCRDLGVASSFVRLLCGGDAQRELIAASHGQPAHIAAWDDPECNRRVGNAYGAIRSTIEAAWVRPRFPGYIRFQHRAGMLLTEHLAGGLTEEAFVAELRERWSEIKPA